MKPPLFRRPTFHFPRPERGRSWVRWFVRALFLIALLVLAWFFLVLAMGIPSSWIRLIEQRLPVTPFAAEAGTISYDIIRGVTMKDARIYHRGDVGLPLVSADRVRLTVNLLELLNGGPWLSDVDITGGAIRAMPGTAPGKGGGGRLDLGTWQFHVQVTDTRIFGERFSDGAADVDVEGARMRLTRVQADIGEEGGAAASIQGSLDLDLESRRYHSALTWSGDPMAVESFIAELGQSASLDYLRLLKAGPRPPAGDAELDGRYGADWAFTLAFSGSARDCTYRGVAIRQLFLNMQFRNSESAPAFLAFDPVVMIREDGLAAGGFSVDFVTGDVRFDGYSTCPPVVLVRLVAPDTADRMAPARVEGPVRIHVGGTANASDLSRNSVTLFLDGQKLGWNRFLADKLAFTAKLTGTSCEIHDVSGVCFGGSFTGLVDVAATWTPERTLSRLQFSAQGGVQDMDGKALAGALGLPATDRYEGKYTLNGRISGASDVADWSGLAGAGTIRVSQGRLFRFPLFGPLSEFLARLIPGLDPQSSLTDAAADWRLEEGRVRSDAIVVGGDRVSLNARGSFALTNSLNYDIQIKLMNTDSLLGLAVRAITLPVSKLFEFRLRGSTQQPHWYPVNFPSDLFDRLTGGSRERRREAASAPAPGTPEKKEDGGP